VEELSATSQSISELSQTQAASIEETSASVEEVAASIEMIAAHAKEQFELSKSTFKSMSELQTVGGDVLESAGEALQLSEQTTSKAYEGASL
jgi:methyl-accepting chemotaxis protein